MKKTFVKPEVSAQPLETQPLLDGSQTPIVMKGTSITDPVSQGFTAAAKHGSTFHEQDILMDI